MRLADLARRLWPALLLAASGALAQPCGSVQDIPDALRRIEPLAQAPAGVSDATPVRLPDTLPLEARRERQRIRYEVDVSACAAAPAAALWVFRVGAPYRISADGQPLALMSANAMAATGSPRLEQDTGGGIYNGRIPALFALPAGVRSVVIELQTLPYMPAGLVKLRTGPTNQLLPEHTASVRSVIGYADAASGVVLVVGLFALLLWLPRRRGLNLLWLAMACGLWGVRGLVYFDNTVPGNPILFEQLNPVNALLAAAAIAASALHLILAPAQRAAALRVLLVLTLLVLGGLAASVLAGHGTGIARALTQITGTGFICWLGIAIWRRRQALPARHTAGLIACVLTVLSCVVHDLLVVAGVLPPTSHTLLFWGFIVVLMGFALMSGEYVVATLNRAERSNEELELHVARKTRDLEDSYVRLRENEQEAVRVQERERLLRDMHDGLGAQLMTALRGVERGALAPQQVVQSLQDSLDELRLLMDSTDIGHYLPGALAAWRNRWDGRLAAAGVALDWDIDESVDQVQLPSDTALQVMRILQEAATNVVKHAQAQRLLLAARVREVAGRRTLSIEIADDGVGPGEEPARAGARGLKNMHYRAGQIGAALAIGARAAPLRGCQVVLSLPLA
ncbi:hypothetical protein [uncultured Ramlibacter sp.]|uniref:sensor histidine kinase n=1 Tax=uncultured Ramlibacter sp. TaxID=260755 RepID=UPI00260BF5B3|nr:hypothetical protein [uncultured Ramlibacter sp.]